MSLNLSQHVDACSGYRYKGKSDGPTRQELGAWKEVGITTKERLDTLADVVKTELSETKWAALQEHAKTKHCAAMQSVLYVNITARLATDTHLEL